jgi:hypothetical protein
MIAKSSAYADALVMPTWPEAAWSAAGLPFLGRHNQVGPGGG